MESWFSTVKIELGETFESIADAQGAALRLHRGLLQPAAPALDPRLREPGTVRTRTSHKIRWQRRQTVYGSRSSPLVQDLLDASVRDTVRDPRTVRLLRYGEHTAKSNRLSSSGRGSLAACVSRLLACHRAPDCKDSVDKARAGSILACATQARACLKRNESTAAGAQRAHRLHKDRRADCSSARRIRGGCWRRMSPYPALDR